MNSKNSSETVRQWAELYTEDLYTWAFHKTSSKEVAEDIVQETFLAALKAIDKFEGKSHPKTWLLAILNNKIIDHYRSNARKQTVFEDIKVENQFDLNENWTEEFQPKSWENETSSLLDDTEFNFVLRNCIEKLPQNWLSAVQMKYLNEKSGEIICQELQITPSNFWQILHRAKLQLRNCLEKRWFNK